jgi:YHS domain-containing protein
MRLALALCLLSPAALLAEPPKPALKGLDPVLLVAGKEEPGKAELSLDHGRFRYLFASEAQRELFRKSPQKYAIQFSGACAKMGPLSGAGNPDRFSVYEGRIYVFASDFCQSTFLANPRQHVEPIEPDWQPSAADVARGRELLALAIRGAGGEQAFRSLKSVRIETQQTITSGQKQVQHTASWIGEFPGRYLRLQRYDDFESREAYDGKRGFYATKTSTYPWDADECEYFVRDMQRQPILLLKQSQEAGALVAAAGRDQAGDVAVELVKIRHSGATTTLGIDAATGRMLSLRYRGRVGGIVGDIVKTYGSFRDVDGITLPQTYSVSRDGQVLFDNRSFSALEINPKIAAEQFQP